MIPQRILKNLYRQALRIRLIEESIADRYKEQEMRCPTHLCIGQEVVSAVVSENLTNEDVVFSTHRSHGHFLAKGGSLKAMLAEMYGKETGCCKGIGGSQHLIDESVNFLGSTPIVGGTIPVAVGSAFASTFLKDKRITVLFLGDAAIEEGVFHESANFAALKRLPVLFVCENNLYSTYTPISQRQPQRPIYRLAQGYGMTAMQEDGTDMIKSYETAKKCIDIVRSGEGPVFIEYLTYRTREHGGPNFDAPGYRPQEEISAWEKKDGVSMYRKYLLGKKILSNKEMAEMEKEIMHEIEKAFVFAKESRYPKEKMDLSWVYKS